MFVYRNLAPSSPLVWTEPSGCLVAPYGQRTPGSWWWMQHNLLLIWSHDPQTWNGSPMGKDIKRLTKATSLRQEAITTWCKPQGKCIVCFLVVLSVRSSLTLAILAFLMVRSCWAITDNTSMSIRLNSSKQHQAPDWARPEKKRPIICRTTITSEQQQQQQQQHPQSNDK